MGMTIDEAMNELKTQIRYYKDFWGADASDYVIDTFNTAISTMRKYEKIKEILKDISYGGEATVRRIQEVIEDGDDD